MLDGFFRAVGNVITTMTPWVTVEPWQQAIRTRLGKFVRRLPPGPHLRIPFIDVVYMQTARTRVAVAPTQTISTKDGHCLVLGAAVRYSIGDIELLYRTLHHPDDTLLQLVASKLAALVTNAKKKDVDPDELGQRAFELLQGEFNDFGIVLEAVTVTDFAFVRTYRFVTDQRYFSLGGLNTTTPVAVGSAAYL